MGRMQLAVTLLSLSIFTIIGFTFAYLERYQISAGGDGLTVWRLDRFTGRVSFCGTMIPGNAYSHAQYQLGRDNPYNLILHGFDPQKDSDKGIFATAETDTKDAEHTLELAQPHCSTETPDDIGALLKPRS